MDTLIKTNSASISAPRAEMIKTKTNSAFWEDMEFNRLGITVALLLIVACLGGASAAFGADRDLIQLGAIAISTVFVESMILSVGPIRLILASAAIALFIDLLSFVF